MAEPVPTEPVRPDPVPVPTRRVTRPSGCQAGHDQPHNPTWHPTLGLVPALTSVILGGIVALGVLALEWWLWPPAVAWTVALLVAGLAVSAGTQLLLGHRGSCFLRRTVRWWLGPIGTLIDPFEMG